MIKFIKSLFKKKRVAIPKPEPKWVGCMKKEEFMSLPSEELIKLGFCPSCVAERGIATKFIRSSGCKECPQCFWAACGG